ncbi:MAG: hypothetical protein J0M12_17450, partial [Deltaproteobacteria bacterium]|nr:hypothetical protein [Deltaproteobacteria bacterium]
ETRVGIAHTFAKSLSRAALYHKMGGDFGTRRASLTPKDVTVHGAILDLHANMLAGAGGAVYRWILHPIKQRWNLENGRETVECFARALELPKEQIAAAVAVFMEQYRVHLKRDPDFKRPYKSPFL